MKVIVGGEAIELGTTEEQPTISIIDYSRRETDDFGVTTVVERGFANRMSVRLAIPFDDVDALQRTLADLRATPVEWVADERFESLSFVGFYKDFSIDLAVPPLSYCTLTIEGLAETDTGADPGGDPAPDQQESTLRLLQPAAIADSMLTAINVPEDDYPAWSVGTTYAHGVRVVRHHRRWESLIVANVGHEPLAGSTQWMDIGPTNRWAMFDEALGTVTQADGNIVLTLDPAQTVDAVALLDVTAALVRVQAPGYDRAKAPIGSPGMVTFLDLPASAEAVTITIAGSGVAVGTLLIGRLVGLGITEASPKAAITDYSRKETDDFGEVTVVERAWAKRMSARALLRTDAVDMVAGRMATVRARPCLWIGAEDLEVLSIYGFYKDFSISIGENVSTLDLSVEGLSKAAPLVPLASPILVTVFKNASSAPTTPEINSGEVPAGWSLAPIALGTNQYRWSTQAMFVAGKQQAAWSDPVRVAGTAWVDVNDNDPLHPKPEDGATNGAPAGSLINGRSAEQVIDDLDSAVDSIAEEVMRAALWRGEADETIYLPDGTALRTVVEAIGSTTEENRVYVAFLKEVGTDGSGKFVLAANSNGDIVGIVGTTGMPDDEVPQLSFVASRFLFVDNSGANPINAFVYEAGVWKLKSIEADTIKAAIVTTDKLVTKAVTDGDRIQQSGTLSGTSSFQEVVSYTLHIPAGETWRVMVITTGYLGFPSGDKLWELQLTFDGSVVQSGGGLKTADLVTMSGFREMTAGDHIVAVNFKGDSSVVANQMGINVIWMKR